VPVLLVVAVSRAQRFQRMLKAAEREQFGDTIKAYWHDPAPFEAEREREQARLNAEIDAAVRRANPHPWEREA
jgi:hypothetical protein